MENYLAKSASSEWKKDLKSKNSYSPGEFYPEIFNNEEEIDFKEDMLMQVGIIWLGAYKLKSSLFQKVKCPICNQETLVPYSCVASVLSGAHIIKFHCLNCKEHIATNKMSSYYHTIRDYIIANRSNLIGDKGKCTTASSNTRFITD